MRYVFASLALMALSSYAYADTILLRDGNEIKGTVTKATENEVFVESEAGPLTIPKTDVEKISYDKPETPAPKPEQPGTASISGHRAPAFAFSVGKKFANDESEDALYFQGDILIPQSENVAFGFGIGHSSFDNKVETLSKGTVSMTPIMAKIRLMTRVDRQISVFLEGGPAYYSLSHDLDGETEDEAQALGVSIIEDLKDVVGGFVGIGFESEVNDILGVQFFATHHFLNPEAEFTVTNLFTGATARATEKVDLSSTILGISLSIAFK